jgi:hypothetical protein
VNKAGGLSEEPLPSKHEALSSNSSTAKKKKNEEDMYSLTNKNREFNTSISHYENYQRKLFRYKKNNTDKISALHKDIKNKCRFGNGANVDIIKYFSLFLNFNCSKI